MEHTPILWRRQDESGHEAASLRRDGTDWLLIGTAVFASTGEPCRLDYRVRCDPEWRTREARVEGWIGGRTLAVSIRTDEGGRWTMNGEEHGAVRGCTDIDLNFSPSTNLLPIRRLALEVGESATVRAAWLRFPSLALEPLEQVYRRTAEDRYRYESAGGAFVADLQVDGDGFVVRYPGGWEAV